MQIRVVEAFSQHFWSFLPDVHLRQQVSFPGEVPQLRLFEDRHTLLSEFVQSKGKDDGDVLKQLVKNCFSSLSLKICVYITNIVFCTQKSTSLLNKYIDYLIFSPPCCKVQRGLSKVLVGDETCKSQEEGRRREIYSHCRSDLQTSPAAAALVPLFCFRSRSQSAGRDFG